MSKLVELLVQGGVLSAEHAHEARQQQVLFGDRIGTSLLAAKLVRETTLAQALGALHGVPCAAGDDANSRAAFTRAIHRTVATALRVVPARVDDSTAWVFMTDPHDTNARAQVGEILGRLVRPVVVCEARMWWLLHKFYMARPGHRRLHLDGDEGPARRRIPKRSESRPTSLFSQDASVEDASAELALPPTSFPHFLMGLFSQPQPQPQGQPPLQEQSPFEELLVELAPADEDQAIVQGTLIDERDKSPLTFAEARTLLAAADDRNAIALIVVRSCLSVFKRAVLFTVHRDSAIGWEAVGLDAAAGEDDVDVKSINLPLRELPSIFKLARDSRAHFLGPLPRETMNILFLKLTGKQIPKSALVVPILVRGQVVNLLYCDNGHGAQVTTDIGDVLVTAQHIARSYEALIAERARARSLTLQRSR